MLLDQLTKQITFDVLWDTSIVGMAFVSKDGEFLYVNPVFCNIIEYAEAEIQGKTFQSITHPEDVTADVEMTKRVVSGELKTYRMKKRYITKTGNVIWILLQVSGLHSPTGEFICFLTQISQLIEMVSPPIVLNTKSNVNLMDWVRTNWQIIVFGMTAIAGIIAYVIEKLR